jgi:hypothetical protein
VIELCNKASSHFFFASNTAVIPAEAEGREPESIITGLWVWIPGSLLRSAPE